MRINEDFFKITEEIQANPERTDFNHFVPIEIEEKDFDFAVELIQKYVPTKHKRFQKCLKSLMISKERFLKQEFYKGQPYYSYPFHEYRYFMNGCIGDITHGHKDRFEIGEKLKEEWNYDYWREFYDKYAYPFLHLIQTYKSLERDKKKVLEVDLNEAKAFIVKETN